MTRKVSDESKEWATDEIERQGGVDAMKRVPVRPFDELRRDVEEFKRTGRRPDRTRT